MRCSSCEPLLAAYLDRELRPRAARAAAAHLETCKACALLLDELRAVDGLLVTNSPPPLLPNLTFATLAQTRGMPVPAKRGIPASVALAFYVACAWIAASAAMALSHGGRLTFGAVVAQVEHPQWWRAISGVLHATVAVTPLVALAVALVLALDVALIVGVLLFYRTVRPRLAARFTPPEAP